MKITPVKIEKYLQLLEDTPRRFAACTQGAGEARLAAAPDGHGWPAIAVLAHQRAGADLWTYNIHTMLAEESPRLTLLDERRWAKAAGCSRVKIRDLPPCAPCIS